MRGTVARRARSVAASIVVAATTFGAFGAFGISRAAAAPATSTEDEARAAALFQEARALIEAGSTAEACEKFAESQRLRPAGGTLMNLAVCHEREGKTATAWDELRDARAFAVRDGRNDRVAFADEHLKTLEPKLSKLVIDVSSALAGPELEIRIDGHLVARTEWGVARAVDPGEHWIDARAPEKKPWRMELPIAPEAEQKTVVVPVLENDRTEAVTPATGSSVEASVAEQRPVRTAPDRTAALIVGGLGAGTIVFASYFGLRAIAKHHDSQDACTTRPCPPASADLNSTAKTFADISTVTFAAGLVGLGVAAYLWFHGDAVAKASGLRVVPAVGPGFAVFGVTSRF